MLLSDNIKKEPHRNQQEGAKTGNRLHQHLHVLAGHPERECGFRGPSEGERGLNPILGLPAQGPSPEKSSKNIQL